MQLATIALVGNPNCGKSTLFNALTGSNQKVGNWPGVTVECKSGTLQLRKEQSTVVDLPGIYQLALHSRNQAIDEQIAAQYLLSQKADLLINVIDASQLEKHLYLTLQILRLNIPVVVAVNMVDIAKRRNMHLDLNRLAQTLGCPVVGLIASKGEGVRELKKVLSEYQVENYPPREFSYPPAIKAAIADIQPLVAATLPEFGVSSEWLSLQLMLEGDNFPLALPANLESQVLAHKTNIEAEMTEELDLILADLFFTKAHIIADEVITRSKVAVTVTERIDKIVLNRFLGIPIFLAVMYLMFLFAINLGGAFQDLFDLSSDAIFVRGTTHLLQAVHAPDWAVAVLAAGLGRGINTTLTFIPVIGGMFFFLALLESCGYMARATFVIDRFMRLVGLPGKAFVPMIVGFGCNVPAILAARTLESPRDRTLTVLMSPFMSCGARLAIFAVFTAAFFPSGGQNVVFLLYLIGITAAILTGLLLRKTLLQGNLSPLVLELPAYHLPSLKLLVLSSWQRLKSFIFRAGKLIIPICMCIGILNAINIDGSLNQRDSSANSLLSAMGRTITPVFAPMGINSSNWPATVGLMTGILAKEVVVASLNTLYSQDITSNDTPTASTSVQSELWDAIVSVPTNIMGLKDSLTNPIIASAPVNTINHHVYGVMYDRFGGQLAAFAYLLFVLLYFPCVSATAVMAKELNKKWATFSILWSTGLAYAAATTFYQLGTFASHPRQSSCYLAVIVTVFWTFIAIMKRKGQVHTITNRQVYS